MKHLKKQSRASLTIWQTLRGIAGSGNRQVSSCQRYVREGGWGGSTGWGIKCNIYYTCKCRKIRVTGIREWKPAEKWWGKQEDPENQTYNMGQRRRTRCWGHMRKEKRFQSPYKKLNIPWSGRGEEGEPERVWWNKRCWSSALSCSYTLYNEENCT